MTNGGYAIDSDLKFSARLAAAMEYAGLNQKQLCARTGFPQSTISSALNRSNGSTDTAVYADACGVSALWLTNGTGSMLETGLKKHSAIVDLSNLQLATIDALTVAMRSGKFDDAACLALMNSLMK